MKKILSILAVSVLMLSCTGVDSGHESPIISYGGETNMNKTLDEIGGVYDKRIKRSRAFCADWIAKGYGETKQNEQGYSSSLFTPAGIMRVTEIFTSEGII